MNQDEINQTQLAEEQAKDRRYRIGKPEAEKAGLLKVLWQNPIVKLIIPTLVENSPLGVFLPAWTGFVVYTYFEEKKAGNNPNIAEYLIFGSMGLIVDVLQLIDFTGFGLILSRVLGFPFWASIWVWRLSKHGLKSPMPTKKMS